MLRPLRWKARQKISPLRGNTRNESLDKHPTLWHTGFIERNRPNRLTFLNNHNVTRTNKTKNYLPETALNLDFYVEMVSYKRKQGSKYQSKFCNRLLKPVFGNPDQLGNYTLIIGDKPTVSFMAHHDTVHRNDGKAKPDVLEDFVVSSTDDCLGADCTTGIFLILRMIQAGIEGVYVIHAAEEIGCVGSRALVKERPDWFDHVKACISLDRKGYSSIITHQMDERTCSDAFADSLNAILDGDFEKDDTGVYTDSNEYAYDIPECTNLSVGYFKQHTKNEHQDWVFMLALADMLVAADWSKLVFERDPNVREYLSKYGNYYSQGHYSGPKANDTKDIDWSDLVDEIRPARSNKHGANPLALEEIEDVVQRYPLQIARLLHDMGYTPDALMDDVGDYLSQRDYY